MIVVKLQGGLGNQMFQYAIGKTLSLYFNSPYYLDLSHLLDRTPTNDYVFRGYDLDLFNIDDIKFYNDDLKKRFWKKKWYHKLVSNQPVYYKENGFNFDENIFGVKRRNLYLDGYWQSFKYFENYKGIIRSQFKFKNDLNTLQQSLLDEISNSNSVCVNFRRTDYVELSSANQVHGVTPLEFYTNSLNLIKNKVNQKLKIFVFSDDIEWCKNNYSSKEEIYFVEHEGYKGERFSAYLELMSNCKFFVIPNSTFAWWAAWLSNVEGENIYVPFDWFKDKTLQSQTNDLIPKTWNRIKL